MTVVEWIKGTPQQDLSDGKVRVLEFWATWCGPCILAMPHLSHLAQQYPEAAFIGVSASENNDNPETVRKFVDTAKDMMAYNVAYATPKGAMSRDWLQASGSGGIPQSFVITGEGRIGWIGHPLMGLEDAVKLAVENKLTPEAAKNIDEQWRAKRVKGQEYDLALKKALAEGRTEDALRLNDAVLENWPYQINIASGKKYALLTAIDPKAARAFGESLLAEYGNAPGLLKGVALTIFEGSDDRVRDEVKVRITGEPDYELAKMLLAKALECSGEDRETIRCMEYIKAWESKQATTE